MTNIQTGIEDMAYRMIEHTVFDGTYRPYLPFDLKSIVKKLYSRFDIHDESDSDEA